MSELTTDEEFRRVLEEARTIAVLGAHTSPEKPARYVPDYLASQGYRILPVNPVFAGRTLWGETVRGTLAEIDEPVDIVDVFRHPELLMTHLDDITSMQPLPKLVWLQLGIRHDEFTRQLTLAGIRVVQDRCTLADHRNFGLEPVAPAR
ncbi:MAG: CoA-binding protein [Acidobacteriota bacterium]